MTGAGRGPGGACGPESTLAHVAASATTPLEAAVVLESEGINDRAARDAFGSVDVFALGELTLGDPARGVSEPVTPAAAEASTPDTGRWFHIRGVLYAVPAVVSLASLPEGDPVASGLVLGGLLVAWASGYGVTSVAWARLGALDLPGCRRVLRRALVFGTLLSFLAACGAVLTTLRLTSTMSVGLPTIALLTGQVSYLLAATALLMCRREPWLLLALLPAAIGAAVAWSEPSRPVTGHAAAHPGPGLWWAAGSVVLAFVLAVVATRDGRPPSARLDRRDRERAVTQVGHGLFVAVLVVFPALDQLIDPGFDPLPLSVTVVVLPVVLAMGVAEALVVRFRLRTAGMLTSTGSAAIFARRAGNAAVISHLTFFATLATMIALAGAIVGATGTRADVRLLLLGSDYLLLGTALFAATVLGVLGRESRVLGVLCGAVTALCAFLTLSEHTSTTSGIVWHGSVSALLCVLLVTAAVGAARDPVRHR